MASFQQVETSLSSVTMEYVALKHLIYNSFYFIADLARGKDTELFFKSFKQLLSFLFEDVAAKQECLASQSQLLATIQVMQNLV